MYALLLTFVEWASWIHRWSYSLWVALLLILSDFEAAKRFGINGFWVSIYLPYRVKLLIWGRVSC